MQTLKIGNTTYKLRPDRDLGPILAAATKKPARRRQSTTAVRNFPVFTPGKTSTAQYVTEYYRLNSAIIAESHYINYARDMFGDLSHDPAPYYVDGDNVEVETCS
jgi:hypothetical protein